MNFWVIIFAVLLNAATGWLFRPYSRGMMNLHVAVSKKYAKKTYKKSSGLGTAVVLIGIISIWLVVDHGIMFLEYKSKIYGYILHGLILYFCIGIGQITGILRKLYKNIENDAFVRELFEYMFVPNIEKVAKVSYKKAYTNALVRIIAEKIIMPAIIMFIFGAGAVVAYTFMNTLAISDNHISVTAHGYAKTATVINKYVTWIGYAVLSLVLWIIKWILGMSFSHKDKDFAYRCSLQIGEYGSNNEFSAKYIKRTLFLVCGVSIVAFLILAAVYIFILTLFAAIGLDKYWNFWNGANIPKQ